MSDVQRVWLVKECREVMECQRCGERVAPSPYGDMRFDHECKEEALEAMRRKYSQRRVG